jgi:hypothetical protein
MNYRGLFKWAGVCAIGFALIGLVSYGIWLATNGFMTASVTAPSPDRIIQMAQARGNHIASRIDLLSYLLWVPALVGLFAYLRERTPGRAYIGGALAGLGVIGFFVTSVMGSALMGFAQGPVTESLKERLVTLDQIAFTFQMQALLAITVCNLLWGMAFRSQTGLSKIVGNLLLTQVAMFLITNAAYIASSSRILNVGILLFNLAFLATFATAGVLLWQTAQQQPEVMPTGEPRARAAGASA